MADREAAQRQSYGVELLAQGVAGAAQPYFAGIVGDGETDDELVAVEPDAGLDLAQVWQDEAQARRPGIGGGVFVRIALSVLLDFFAHR